MSDHTRCRFGRRVSKHLRIRLVLLALAWLPIVGCTESEHTLAAGARLPKWFASDTNLPRSSLTVTLRYQSLPWGRRAQLSLFDAKGQRISRVTASLEGNEPKTAKARTDSRDPHAYPSYEIASANGITEVIEHRRMEPIFYINDDPALHRLLGLR